MYIKYDGFTLEITESELWNIAESLLFNAFSNFEDHWKRFDVDTWKKNTRYLTEMAEILCRSIGREDLYNSKMKEAEDKLKKMIEDNEKKN